MRKRCAFPHSWPVASVWKVECWGLGLPQPSCYLEDSGWGQLRKKMEGTWSCCLALREAPSRGDFNYLQSYGLCTPPPTSFTGSQPWMPIRSPTDVPWVPPQRFWLNWFKVQPRKRLLKTPQVMLMSNQGWEQLSNCKPPPLFPLEGYVSTSDSGYLHLFLPSSW